MVDSVVGYSDPNECSSILRGARKCVWAYIHVQLYEEILVFRAAAVRTRESATAPGLTAYSSRAASQPAEQAAANSRSSRSRPIDQIRSSRQQIEQITKIS